MHGTKTGHHSARSTTNKEEYTGAAVTPLTHHRRGPISDLLVLQVGQLTQDLGGWVLHFQQLQDGRAIVGDGHVLSKHPQETDQQLRPHHNVSYGVKQDSKRDRYCLGVTQTPMSSTSILSRPTGPRELLTMLAMDAAAMTAKTIKKH